MRKLVKDTPPQENRETYGAEKHIERDIVRKGPNLLKHCLSPVGMSQQFCRLGKGGADEVV